MFFKCLNKLLSVTGFFSVLLLLGCRDLVQDEFNDFTVVPTVNSFLIGDSLIKVHVSLSGKLDTIPITLVDNATVSCYVNDSLIGNLSSAGNGYYTGETIATAGSVYHFNVTVPGFTEMTAIDTIPEPVTLSRIEHINIAGIDEEGNTYPAIRITFPVDPVHIQYFQVGIRFIYYNEWRSGQFKDFSDPVLLAEGLPIAVFNSSRIQDTTYTLHLDYTTGYTSTQNGVATTDLFPMVVEFKTISRQYYKYLRQLYLYKTSRYPEFQFGPYKAFDLYSNITNGMGIIAGYSVYQSELITPSP